VIIVDASVALKWIVPEVDGQMEADSVLRHDELWAPDMLLVEVGNVLRRKVAAGDVQADDALAGLRTLAETVGLIGVDSALATAALGLAVRLAHSVYDCLYLATAERLDGRVATRDAEFSRRVRRAGFGHRLATLPLRAAGSE
jgi:predicted nucleic acid-binding protein